MLAVSRSVENQLNNSSVVVKGPKGLNVKIGIEPVKFQGHDLEYVAYAHYLTPLTEASLLLGHKANNMMWSGWSKKKDAVDFLIKKFNLAK